jgi:glutamate-ammonia-ligase adenylyltransferase
MLEQHASNSDEFFDIKQDRGGLIDVEFIVQYLILGHAHSTNGCAATSATSRCSHRRRTRTDSDRSCRAVRDAYRDYRRMQHVLRLNAGRRARVERATVGRRIEAVRALWQQVFELP